MTYRMNSCYDGDLHLHSDDPESDYWVVEVQRNGHDELEVCKECGFVSITGTVSRNGWYVDGCSRIRITNSAGDSTEHTMGSYPTIRSGEWDWPAAAN